ncbi:inorganic diphosphatase [Buchnera aphidicola]|uniref:Inorganic pyrophosphatase n=1 Tax=Buchnera aphidicola (Stegophylla sp.) TaxID=2315800 RepID=A0A4D6YIP4_9GAMM|nr:inorganic diphosphatase [Buchnera aphidicola (Stegophylla sp.)]QCI26251.1 inorganic diphosphatase [Buchnera aphidicola (Stegophylla sp.)]
MNLKYVPTGVKVPNDIYVIIEIPLYSHPIKYEMDKKTETLYVDRFINTSMVYPCNYGYINNTLANDGDPLDVLIPIEYSLQPSCVIQCRPIGLLRMIDESGEDSKIIAIPHEKIHNDYKKIIDINDLPNLTKQKIVHFFTHYKDLEPGKWVKIIGLENAQSAQKEIMLSINQAVKNTVKNVL